MGVTTGEAIAAVRARLNAGSYGFPLYYHGDDAPDLPDTPATFAYVVFNNEGSNLVAFGGGRGESIYRNRARVETFVFSPIGLGAETVANEAETIAVRLRSYRDEIISCFSSDVIPIGPGATLSVPGLNNEVNNYQCALVESILYFDQTGGGVVDVVPPPDSIPAWVPANAKIHIDFLGGTPQGRAWSNGAEVAIDTLLGSDPNTENAWEVTSYDEAFLTADGYSNPTNPPAFIGEARTRITSSATMTCKLQQSGSGTLSSPAFVLASADGTDALEIDLLRETGPGMVVAVISSWNGEPEVMSPPVINIGDGVFNKIALTVTGTRFESSFNGCNPIVYPVTEAGRPAGNPLVAALLDIVVSSATASEALQSITIYDPLPDTTGLSELSAIT